MFKAILTMLNKTGSMSANCENCNEISHGGYGEATADNIREYLENLAMDHVRKTGHTVILKTRKVVVKPE